MQDENLKVSWKKETFGKRRHWAWTINPEYLLSPNFPGKIFFEMKSWFQM